MYSTFEFPTFSLFPQESHRYLCDGDANVICLRGWREPSDQDLVDPRKPCPEPVCDLGQSECRRTVNMIRNLFSTCVQSEEGQHVGCVTDKLGGGTITLPRYATMCSAMCYEGKQENLARVHRCPHPGFRQHDPDLQKLF